MTASELMISEGGPKEPLEIALLALHFAGETPSLTVEETRQRFLTLACSACPTPARTALLWLYDPEFSVFRLSHAFPVKLRPELTGRRISIDAADKKIPEILETLRPMLLGDIPIVETSTPADTRPDQLLLPLTNPPDSKEAAHLVGILHLIGPTLPAPSATGALDIILAGLALAIEQSRSRRRLEALTELQSGFSSTASLEQYLNRVAMTLRKVIDAELCIIYIQRGDQTLTPLAISPAAVIHELPIASAKSLTGDILRRAQPVRVSDFRDVAERQRVFGTSEYDQHLHSALDRFLPSGSCCSMLASPVLVGGFPFALVKLVNKKNHLAGDFSPTDQDIARRACDVMAAIIPSIQTGRITAMITTSVFSGELDQDSTRQSIYEVLRDLVPGLAGAALIEHGKGSAPPRVVHLGGIAEVIAAEGAVTSSNAEGLPAKTALHQRQITIPGLHPKAYLALRFSHPGITPYQTEMLSFVCRELSQVLRGERHVKDALQDVVQLRHAIRAGLTGVIGHIHQAVMFYRNLNKRDFPRELIIQAQFRKSLERANLFARRTHVFMEEARFLLGKPTRKSLRITSVVVGALIAEIVECLKPAAERREVRCEVVNQLPGAMGVINADRELMYILFFNVIDNAVKYSHRGQDVSVTISQERAQVKVAVVDFGVYIRRADRAVIFEAFERRGTGDAGTTRPGTGLGLAVAKEIAEAHGGAIEVDSRRLRHPPTGIARTAFTIGLPRHLREE